MYIPNCLKWIGNYNAITHYGDDGKFHEQKNLLTQENFIAVFFLILCYFIPSVFYENNTVGIDRPSMKLLIV